VTELEALTRDYRTAFLRYLPGRSEAALTQGYELGRQAVVDGVSMLDVTQVHHTVLAEVLVDTAPGDTPALTAAAAEFLVEVLSTFDMAHRLQDRPRGNGREDAGASRGTDEPVTSPPAR
jgi:hypothetical protein